jgi:hypothetical protein
MMRVPRPSPQYAAGDDLPIKEVQRRLFNTQELAAAAEAFAISSFIGEARRLCMHMSAGWLGD